MNDDIRQWVDNYEQNESLSEAYLLPEDEDGYYQQLDDARVVRGEVTKEDLHRSLQDDVDAFLAAGNSVTILPQGAETGQRLSAGRGKQTGRKFMGPNYSRNQGRSAMRR